jgi:Biotin-lipoyl like
MTQGIYRGAEEDPDACRYGSAGGALHPGGLAGGCLQKGQRVEEGQVLARLDDRDYQARLDSARAVEESVKRERAAAARAIGARSTAG